MKYLADNQLIPKDTCLRMIVGTDEEESWQCIRYYLDHAEILPQVSIVPDANFPLLYCEKGLLDFDLSSVESVDERAEIQIVELKGGRSRDHRWIFEIVSQRDQYTLYESGKRV